jgi:hypothetical protein
MSINSFDGIAELERMAVEGRQLIADLIGETLTRAGERKAIHGIGGYQVQVGRLKYEGHLEQYSVGCTEEEDRFDSLERYAQVLAGAGWFVEPPHLADFSITVEVIGDALLDRAPEWLCERWEAIR